MSEPRISRGLFTTPAYKVPAFTTCVVAGALAELLAVFRISDVAITVAVIDIVFYPICAAAIVLRAIRTGQIWWLRHRRR